MVSTTQLIMGAALLGGAYYVSVINPQFIPNTISQIQSALSNLGPKPTVPASGAAPVSGVSTPVGATNVNPTGAPTQAIVTPPLSSIEGSIIIPFQQNQFCDSSFGLYWDPLQGRCVQQLRGGGGRCAPGSVFNHCGCQCVPAGSLQPECWRDCTKSCPDKINQRWNYCLLGCVPKSYQGPDCPPL